MAKLIEFRVDDLTIPYKSPNGHLNIFLNIENVDLVEIFANGKIKIDIDNNVIYPENSSSINNNYNFDILIERNDFPEAGTYSIDIVAKTYNFSLNEILEHTITKDILIEDSYPETTAEYFIDITANINKSLLYQDNSIVYNGKLINKNNNYNILYNLPTGAKTINIGNINANDPTNKTLGMFTPNLTITAYSDGTSSAKIDMSGNNILAEIEEDPSTAQKVYWGSDVPVIFSDSADTLSSLLTPLNVETEFENDIKLIEELYSQNIIKDWNFNILPVNAAAINLLNVFDAYAEIKNRQFPNIFLNGEHIILQTGYPYQYTIEDYNGVTQYIIEETPIYARITHNDDAPII
jgi:hypothetical protein